MLVSQTGMQKIFSLFSSLGLLSKFGSANQQVNFAGPWIFFVRSHLLTHAFVFQITKTHPEYAGMVN